MCARANDSTHVSSFTATIQSFTFEYQDREAAWLWDAFRSVFVSENVLLVAPRDGGQVALCISCLPILIIAASGLHKPKLNQSTYRGTFQWQHLGTAEPEPSL